MRRTRTQHARRQAASVASQAQRLSDMAAGSASAASRRHTGGRLGGRLGQRHRRQSALDLHGMGRPQGRSRSCARGQQTRRHQGARARQASVEGMAAAGFGHTAASRRPQRWWARAEAPAAASTRLRNMRDDCRTHSRTSTGNQHAGTQGHGHDDVSRRAQQQQPRHQLAHQELKLGSSSMPSTRSSPTGHLNDDAATTSSESNQRQADTCRRSETSRQQLHRGEAAQHRAPPPPHTHVVEGGAKAEQPHLSRGP